MDIIKLAGVAIVTAIIVLVGGAWLNKSDAPLGAVASPLLISNYFGYGGMVEFRAKTDALNSASTTVCSLQSPAATSTLKDAAIRLSVSSTTASVVAFSKGTGFSSSTLFQSYSVSANAQATVSLLATTTTAGADNLTFAPNTYFNVTMSGGVGTFSPTGTCQATWQAI